MSVEELVKVGREEWGAQPPLEQVPLPHPVRTASFSFNTGVPKCRTREECLATMKQLQKAHMDMGYADIFYNFCVGGDNTVYEGRGWHVSYPRIANYKQCYGNTIIIGVIGDGKPDTRNWEVPYSILMPGMRLINEGVKLNYMVEEHSVFEDHRPIVPCQMPYC